MAASFGQKVFKGEPAAIIRVRGDRRLQRQTRPSQTQQSTNGRRHEQLEHAPHDRFSISFHDRHWLQ